LGARTISELKKFPDTMQAAATGAATDTHPEATERLAPCAERRATREGDPQSTPWLARPPRQTARFEWVAEVVSRLVQQAVSQARADDRADQT